jgi:hypothetical protein
MEKINLIQKVKSLYDNGENIIDYLKKIANREQNTIEDILISYDFQAGTYIKYAQDNPEHINKYSTEIANIISGLDGIRSLMEAGVGEATTLTNVLLKLNNENLSSCGFDISWSRIEKARSYTKALQNIPRLFVGDLFQIPLADNSIDLVYTSHSIEPNGGKEKQAIAELYRVTSKYLILLEPTDEFATTEGKERMRRLGYVTNLKSVIQEMGLNLVDYKPFPVFTNPLNPTGLYVIKKDHSLLTQEKFYFTCPMSGAFLEEYADHFFCRESLISYPKINQIPCLLPQYGILTSKHE